MKALFVLLLATAALASHTYSTPYTYSPPPFPVTSLVFVIIFGVFFVINILWIIKVARTKIDHNSSDVEQQSLVGSTLPEGVVSTNITVSAKNRPSLLGELRHDENLVWAHETVSPFHRSLVAALIFALFFVLIGLATSITFFCVFDGEMDIIFLQLWIPLAVFASLIYMTVGIASKSAYRSVIYALTSKRVFMFSRGPSPQCCGGKVETVRAYDLDGIHQTTLTRKDDGSGTLTFSAAAIADGAYAGNQNVGMFAFTNIPNVTAVKDLIEQYKTLRKKQAGNQ